MLPLPRRPGAVVLACALLASALAGLGACGLVASLGADYTSGPEDAGQDGRPIDATPDSRADATMDAASDAPDAIVSPPTGCDGGFTCVAPAPQGWTGPLALYAGSAPAPACAVNGPGYQKSPALSGGTGSSSVSPAMCNCTCSATCKNQLATVFTDGMCSMMCGSVDLPLDGTCTTVTPAQICPQTTAASFTLDLPAPPTPSCVPAQATTLPPVIYSTTTVACAPSVPPALGSCTAGDVCMPTPTAPYVLACVFQSGVQTCPAGPYTSSHLVELPNDTRACGACSCGRASDAGAGACSSTVHWYESGDLSCMNELVPAPTVDTCNSVPLQPWTEGRDFNATTSPITGTCPATAGVPDGGVTFDPVTLCCTP